MKKNILIASVALAALWSCTPDDNPAPEEPLFPEELASQEYEPSDDIHTLTFDANIDWTLNTDVQWLTFEDEFMGSQPSASGKAGKDIQVEFKVNDKGWGTTEEVATVTITMAGKSSALIAITRLPKDRIVKMYANIGYDEPSEMEELHIRTIVEGDFPEEKVKYDEMASVGFYANFDWKIIEAPEWLDVYGNVTFDNLYGAAEQENSKDRMVKFYADWSKRYEDQTGKVTLSNVSGSYTKSFDIRMDTVHDKHVHWMARENDIKNGISWNSKGKYLKPGSGSSVPSDEPFSISFVTKGNDYEIKFVTYDRRATEITPDWIEMTDDKAGNISLEVKENTADARDVYMFVVPKAISDLYQGNLTMFYRSYFQNGFVFKSDGCAVKLHQETAPGTGFTVGYAKSSMGLAGDYTDDVKEVSADEIKAIVNGLKSQSMNISRTDNVYEMTFTEQVWNTVSETANSKLVISPERSGVSASGVNPQIQFKFYRRSTFEPVYMATGVQGVWCEGISGSFLIDTVTYQPAFSLVMQKVKGFSALPDYDMIVVFCDNSGKDVGTFIIRK